MPVTILFSVNLSSIPLYLDPGSGSFLLQLLIAAILGGAFAVKVYWKKIKAFFTGKKEETPAESVETIEPASDPTDPNDK
jgi:hypothetical protein